MLAPNLDLLAWSDKTKKVGKYPYIAVFKKDGKTLVYLASEHSAQKTFEMVDFAFAKFQPGVAVVEYKNKRFAIPLSGKGYFHESVYTAAVAARNNIPVVLADIGYSEEACKRAYELSGNAEWTIKAFYLRWIITNMLLHERQFGTKTTLAKEIKNFTSIIYKDWMGVPLTEDEIKELFKSEFGVDFDPMNLAEVLPRGWKTPKESGTIINRFCNYADYYARDPFMIQNITNALNKYDVVFAVFGEGHYRTQRLVLEDMMGTPEYIWGAE